MDEKKDITGVGRLRAMLCLLFGLFISIVAEVSAKPPPISTAIDLTEREIQFLKNHPVVYLGTDPTWAPYVSADKKGQPIGYVADYIRLIEQNTGLKIEVIFDQWSEVLKDAKQRKIDGLAWSTMNPEREKHFLFSRALHTDYRALFGRKDLVEKTPLAGLMGKTVVVQRGNSVDEITARRVEGLNIRYADSANDMISAVFEGRVDYLMVGYSWVARSNIPAVLSLRAAHVFTDYPVDYVFSLRNDWPELQSIMDKGLAAISATEKRTISDKWLSAKVSKDDGLKVSLNDVEKQFVLDHPNITLAGSEDFRPYIFLAEGGQVEGIAPDFLTRINQLTGLNITIRVDDWQTMIDKARSRELDGFAIGSSRTMQKELFIASTPISREYPVVFVKAGNPKDIQTIGDLRHKRMALPSRTPMLENMKSSLVGVEGVYTNSVIEQVQAVVSGEADFGVFMRNVLYVAQAAGLEDYIDIAFPIGEEFDSAFIFRSDWPELASIVDKALDSISVHDKREIFSRWALNKKIQGARHSRIELTEQQQLFVNKHPIIRVANDRNYPPLDFHSDGKASGYSVDLVKLLARRLGFGVETVTGDSWNLLIDQFRGGEIDVLSSILLVEDNLDFIEYSDAYLTSSDAVLSRVDSENIRTLGGLEGKILAMPEGFEYLQILANNNVRVKHLPVEDMEAAVEAVANGLADVAMESSVVLQYIVDSKGYMNLKHSVLEDRRGEADYRFGVRKPMAPLASMLNKAISQLSIEDRNQLKGKWFGDSKGVKTEELLTAEERQWLHEHPVIKISNEMDFPPYDFVEQGVPKGASIDVIQLIAKKMDLNIEFVNGLSWAELLEQFNRGEIHVMQPVSVGRQMLLSRPHIATDRYLVVTRTNEEKLSAITDIEGKRIAVIAGYQMATSLGAVYPGNKQVIVKDVAGALTALKLGKADVYFEDKNLIYYLRNKELTKKRDLLEGLQIYQWEFSISGGVLSLGVSEANPELMSILNKGLNQISTKEFNGINRKWLGNFLGRIAIDASIDLSPDEQEWLTGQQGISACVKTNSLPLNNTYRDGHSGIVPDYLTLFGKNLFYGISLAELNGSLQASKCQFIADSTEKEAEEDGLLLTNPYLSVPVVLTTRSEDLLIVDLADLSGRKVAVENGGSYIDKLKVNHPDIELVSTDSPEDALNLVTAGQVAGALLPNVVASYTIKKMGASNIRLTGFTPYKFELGFAVPPDQPLLLSILNKAIASVSNDQQRQIVNNWLGLQIESETDYQLLLQILLGLLLAISVFVYWNRKLALLNSQITEKSEQITEKSNQVSRLLDTSMEGFLSFGVDLVVHPQYSRACEEMLGCNPAGLPITSVLYPHAGNESSFLSDVLPKIFVEADDFKQQMKLSLLPDELSVDTRVLRAVYKCVDPSTIVLILHDITHEKVLEERVKQEQRRLEMIVTAVSESRWFYELINDFRVFYRDELHKILASEQPVNETIKELFRAIHTFKGLFAQFSFPNLPGILHQLETQLAGLQDKPESSNQTDTLELSRLFENVDFESLLTADLEPVFVALGRDFLDKRGVLNISRNQARALELSAVSLAQGNDQVSTDPKYVALLEDLRALRSINIRQAIAPFSPMVNQLAKRLGKQVLPLLVEGETVHIDPNVYDTLVKSLIHVFRNAVDHGLESPEVRQRCNKPVAGKIVCVVTTQESELSIRISDDGAGINADELRNILVARGFLDGPRAAKMSNGQVLACLFDDAVSSQERTSDLSGRGVGLAVVRAEAEKLGGRVRIDSEVITGTSIEIFIPLTDHVIIGKAA